MDDMPQSQSCELCGLILMGRLPDAIIYLEGRENEMDLDGLAVYHVVKHYCQYLGDTAEKDLVSLSLVWKQDAVQDSKVRTHTLTILRQLFKLGLTPNTVTSSETPLMAAVGSHDEGLIRLLLENGANPNLMPVSGGMNAFALAIILNEVAVIKLMLTYGARINKPCCQEMTPLQLSMNKSVEVSKLLLQNGARVQQVLQMQGTSTINLAMPPLMHAVNTNNIYLASILLEHGEDINQSYGECSDSPIHLAVLQGSEEMVKLLIQYGANLDKSNRRGSTPLGLALNRRRNGETICQALVSGGCSLRKSSMLSAFRKHYPPVHIAAYLGHGFHLDFIKLVLEKSDQWYGQLEGEVTPAESNVNKRRHCVSTSERSVNLQKQGEHDFINMPALDKSTPLFMAVLGGNVKIVKHLYECGGDPYLTCCHGNLLHAAVMAGVGREEVLKFVMQFDFDINHLNDDGNSPLILAARNTNLAVCKLLIQNGACLNIQDGRYGETALSASVYFGCEENAEILLQHGADPDIPDSRNTAAIYWAIFNCRERTLIKLLEAGARLSREDLNRYPRNIKIMKNASMKEILTDYVSHPASLQQCCRGGIRRQVSQVHCGKSVLESIQQLPLPRKIISFLSLETE